VQHEASTLPIIDDTKCGCRNHQEPATPSVLTRGRRNRNQAALIHAITPLRLSAMSARQLWRDDDGVILPYVAITLVAIIGLSALVLDGGRLMSLQTQIQNSADAFALAGAAELDRRPDSIIRAQAAVRDLVTNSVSGAGVRQATQISRIDFLKTLPASDDLPIASINLTDDPTLAAYVQVAVKPVAMQMILPVSLSAERSSIAVGAQSVAGYDEIVCDVAPVYVCNPFETAGMTYYQATQALIEADRNPTAHRQLLRLVGSQFTNGGYSAGDIGFLIAATGSLPTSACGPAGGRGIPQALAATHLRACFRLSGVNLAPSDDQPAMDGLNTRFDIYANGFNSCRSYPPDQNVRKGFTAAGNANWCNAGPDGPNWPMPTPEASAFPVDQNMVRPADQSLDTSISVGNGTWNCAAYWSTAHFAGPGKNLPPPGCGASATISRYDVYRYELNFPTDRSRGAEFAGPQCAPPGVANRRIITAAIINCGSSPVPVLNDAHAVPVAGFGKFFLALPALRGTNDNPYAEFVGLVKRSDPLSTDMIQLNR
jgi:Flp pilus assembly protein TadG